MNHPILSENNDLNENAVAMLYKLNKTLISKEIIRRFLLAGFFGAALGFFCWFFFKNYTSELTLRLGSNAQIGARASFDESSFENIKAGLPVLADRAIQDGFIKDSQLIHFDRMRKKNWWSNNLSAVYGSPNSSGSSGKSVTALMVRGSGSSNQDALNEATTTVDFLRIGGAFLEVKNILNDYQSELTIGKANNELSIANLRLNIARLQDRIENKEVFLKKQSRYVSSTSPLSGIGASYLTLINQIFIEEAEVMQLKSNLSDALQLQKKIDLMGVFFSEATPLSEKTIDGLLLSRELMGVVNRLRERSNISLIEKLFLDEVHARLVPIEFNFSHVLISQNSERTGVFRAILLGFISVIFLSFVPIFVRKISHSDQKSC